MPIGPRMRTGVFRSKGKKRGRPRKYTATSKKGLTLKEKRQVNNLISKRAESKYFKPDHTLVHQAFKFQSQTGSRCEIMCRGFAVGQGEVNGVAGTYGYESVGGAARVITPINMVRTFDSSVVEGTDYEGMIPDGKYVSPHMAKCTWRIHRTILDTATSENVKSSAPYLVRFIRVVPRSSKYSGASYVPAEDLFMNNFGVAFGVDSTPTTNQHNFGLFELQTSKINTRKYRILQDTQFNLACPNINTQFGDNTLQVNETNMNHQKTLVTNHKQPKKLYYEGTYDNADSRQPIAGQSGELIFIHCAPVGTTTKEIQVDARIDVKPISTFKDI